MLKNLVISHTTRWLLIWNLKVKLNDQNKYMVETVNKSCKDKNIF